MFFRKQINFIIDIEKLPNKIKDYVSMEEVHLLVGITDSILLGFFNGKTKDIYILLNRYHYVIDFETKSAIQKFIKRVSSTIQHEIIHQEIYACLGSRTVRKINYSHHEKVVDKMQDA